MKTLAGMVLGALVSTTALADAPLDVDIRSDNVRAIVRGVAARQSVAVQVVERKAAPKLPSRAVQFVPPEKPPLMKTVSIAPAPAQPSSPLVDALFDIAFDTLLRAADDSSSSTAGTWSACKPQSAPAQTPQISTMCRVEKH